MTADLADSVKTDGVKKAFPERHIECGIAEQHMVSTAGGLSLRGFVPFASTFGAFMTSRAKDQARVNDVNETNVKMVATHCGLSVGEDGPTHQAIDDISSFAGFFHTQILEPADPNQCDRMIRYVAATHGNFYVRMGRAKTPVLLGDDGQPFFGGSYEFKPGRADVLRTGARATVVASGAMVTYALRAIEAVGGGIDLIVVSSFIPFDYETVVASAKKTGRVVTVQDHNVDTGLGSYVQEALFEAGVLVPVKRMGVAAYQLSGTADELYEKAGFSQRHIEEELKKLLA
jgi:transketolase